MKDIILLGIGGHAHSVVDSIEQTGEYNIIGFLDTEEMQGEHFRDYRVLGTDDELEKYYTNGVKNAFVTIGFMGHGDVRNKLYSQLKGIGYRLPNIIDSTAVVAADVGFEDGIFVGKRAVINANAQIGKMCIINTGAIIEHDCQVGEFSHISVGSVLCGNVKVGRESFVGANATVIQGRYVGDGCIIGAGMTIRRNVEDNHMLYCDNILKISRGGVN